MDRIPEPTNDHERTIAEALDSKLLATDCSYESVLAETVTSVPFVMSIGETQFLFNYAHWRLAQRAKKQPERGILSEHLKRGG